MILTVAELKQYMQPEDSDSVLTVKLSALELMIRAYTNNNFMNRAFRTSAEAVAEHSIITMGVVPFRAGDTVQITDSEYQTDKLLTISSVVNGLITVSEDVLDETGITITKVEYPADIKIGVVNLMKWEQENRDKVGIQSETISRHSVTYFSMDDGNAVCGYPKPLMAFLKPYMKARFGRGIRV